jgi:hypothetical protein
VKRLQHAQDHRAGAPGLIITILPAAAVAAGFTLKIERA